MLVCQNERHIKMSQLLCTLVYLETWIKYFHDKTFQYNKKTKFIKNRVLYKGRYHCLLG